MFNIWLYKETELSSSLDVVAEEKKKIKCTTLKFLSQMFDTNLKQFLFQTLNKLNELLKVFPIKKVF